MKTSTEVFQVFCAIFVHTKAPKNTQAKVLEKNASWQHALMIMTLHSDDDHPDQMDDANLKMRMECGEEFQLLLFALLAINWR